MPVIPAMWEAELGGSWSEAGPSQKAQDPIKKKTKAKKGITQMVGCLPSKHKAQSCHSSSGKKKRARQEGTHEDKKKKKKKNGDTM
jgi:hypothetical protein